MKTYNLTGKKHTLCYTLAYCLRFVLICQTAELFWPDSPHRSRYARRLHRWLLDNGFVKTERIVIHPLLRLTKPVYSWPGTELDEWAISYQLQSRWTERQISATAFVATPKTIGLLGGVAGKIKPLQATHDAHIGSIFANYVSSDPAVLFSWRGEDLYASDAAPGEPLPDAMLFNESGEPYRAIEQGGHYSGTRVRAIVQWALAHPHRLSGEIW